MLPGFHADPSICRVGDDYYLATSSFEYFPGVPIFHSRDLVHWRQIGNVLTRKSQLNLEGLGSSLGIYAPTLRYHRGTFYMVTTVVGGGGNFYVTAPDAAGPWSDPVWLDREGADPSLFFDEDGKVYYQRQVGGRDGFIGQHELNPGTGRPEGEMRDLWSGTGGIWPEGPHMYKVGDCYYLLISEGGTSYEHCLTVARSRSPWGPFESNSANPILTHRHLPEHPFHALGHGDFVETPGGWWVVFLGIRPRGGRFHHLGRETFLAPVEWSGDGWPVVNGARPISESLPVPALATHEFSREPVRDDFTNAELEPCWQFVRNPDPQCWSLTERPGWLRLRGLAGSLRDTAPVAFVGRAQTAFTMRISARMDFDPKSPCEEAGLALRGNERNHCIAGIRLRDGARRAFLRTVLDDLAVEHFSDAVLPDAAVVFSIVAEPLRYTFFVRESEGVDVALGSLPTQELSTEVLSAQKAAEVMTFTGVYAGVYASGNGRPSSEPADFDWFDFEIGGN